MKLLRFREVAAYGELFKSLCTIADCLMENHRKSTDNRLYSEDEEHKKNVTKLLKSINLQSCYGRVSQFHVKLNFNPKFKLCSVFISVSRFS